MTARSAGTDGVRTPPGGGRTALGVRGGGRWIAPLTLFAIAAAIRLAAASLVPFPATEGSAYYVAVARNALDSDGLVSDALWSYATPPLSVPRPAFELWMPMSTFVSLAGMAILGPSYWAAQVASSLLGALLAPLAWGVGRAAGQAAGLDGRRNAAVAATAGLLVAVAGPFVLASAVPDSYTPYVVATVGAALLVPAAVSGARPDPWRAALLGVLLGVAYLSRQEVVWLGLAVAIAALVAVRGQRRAASRMLGRLTPVVVGGAAVVLPWLARNASAFGTPFPGQALENAVLRRNEDIFAFVDRPSLAAYLAQDLGVLINNPVTAAWDALLNVLVIPAFPLGVAGILSVAVMWRSPAFRVSGPLGVLLLSGGLTFAATMLLFPVATRWGTFLHASGPLLVALTVAAALGGDALLARISTLRRWARPNVIVAPIALAAATVLLLVLQVLLVGRQSSELEDLYDSIAGALRSAADVTGEPLPRVLISDHPIWLAASLDRAAVALPDEDLSAIARLGRVFDTSWLAIIDRRGRYPGALLDPAARRCLRGDPMPLASDPEVPGRDPASGWLFRLHPGCEAAGVEGA